MSHLLNSADRWLLRLDQLLLGAAAVAIVTMMVITTADVAMRYAFNAPIRWAFTFLTSYLLSAAFWLGFSYALRIGHHISVDYFVRRIPVGLHRAGLVFGHLGGAAIFGAVAVFGAVDTRAAWLRGDVVFGDILWPVWLYKIIIPLGMVPLALRCLLRAVECVSIWDEVEARAAREKAAETELGIVGDRM